MGTIHLVSTLKFLSTCLTPPVPPQPLKVETNFHAFNTASVPGGPLSDLSWLDDLNVGDCVDGQPPNGDWEISIIDAISPTRTEVSITWSTGMQEWLSLEERPLRIAKFGVMTDAMSTNGGAVPTAPPGIGMSAYAQTSPAPPAAPLLSEADMAWRLGLRAGDLLDAKDKSGVWYQVRATT